MLAVGAHLKSAVAVAKSDDVFISQHLGDLETEEALGAFMHEAEAMQRLYAIRPAGVVSDCHPDYLSTAYAHKSGCPVHAVQHHYAHVAACMAENGLDGRVLGVSWDGTGYGDDGTVWGGEFLLTDDTGYQRVAAFRSFRLPGGETAVREPRRSALGLLHALHGEQPAEMDDLPSLRAFTLQERRTLVRMMKAGTQAPLTSSAGRLFDAIASLCGLRQRSSFEGQAAMELEWAVPADARGAHPYPVELHPAAPGKPAVVDWGPMIESVEADVRSGEPPAAIAARFHLAMVAVVLAVARLIGEPRIVLTGGCFQNRILTERAVLDLTEAGFRPYWHQRVPPNDGGIALGQVYAAVRAGAFTVLQDG
jgi:hydrogenase maturation protein HypF